MEAQRLETGATQIGSPVGSRWHTDGTTGRKPVPQGYTGRKPVPHVGDRARRVGGYLAYPPHDEPTPAIELAGVIGAKGSRETRRRTVREIVRYCREEMGLRICADETGYWLARSAAEWSDYAESVKTGARFRFVAARKQREAVTDRMNEQRRLW